MRLLLSLYAVFFRIGLFTFGGGYAMLPMLEREIVTKHGWATMEEIMNYFAIGQCTPGIIAVNTATFVGYKNKGIAGGIAATLGMISPSLIIISLIASVLERVMDKPIVQHAFAGISVAVCALLIQSIIKMGKSGIKHIFGGILALSAFCLSVFLGVSPIIIVLYSGVLGVVYQVVKEKRGQRK